MLPGCTQKSETETDSSDLSPEHLTEKSFLIPETRTGWTTYTAENGLEANHVVGIAVDNDSVKWFGTMGGGVSSFDGTIWKTYIKDDGLVSNHILAVAVDADNVKWFGTAEEGHVLRFDRTVWQTYTKEDGLVSDLIFSLAIDEDNVKWIGTAAGVSSYDDN